MGKTLSLITGAAGHLGYNLLLELLARGENVRILIRKNNPIFNTLDCEIFYGDITDINCLNRAFKGVNTVYHFAGIVDIAGSSEKEIWNVNFGGTKNVVSACRTCAVGRLIFASSVDVFPPLPDNAEMRELKVFSAHEVEGTYAKTKATATQYILDECASGGLDAVIIHFGACIGPYDFKISSAGSLFRMYLSNKLPFTMSFGAYNFIDVRDAAKGAVLAAEKGRSGECYIMTGHIVTIEEFITLMAKKTGRKPPSITVGKSLVNASTLFMEQYYRLSKTTPLFTRYSFRKLCSNCNFSSRKAAQELGFGVRQIEETISDTIDWLISSRK